MSGFISLRDAARILADDAGDEIETWLAVLVRYADELHAVTRSIERHSHIPGGVSYVLQPDDWRIPTAAFTAWRDAHGFASRRHSDTPQPWDSLRPEQRKSAWEALDPEARRSKAAELVKKHGGNKTAAGREVGITGNRIAQLLRETEEQAEAPLPVNKWTQAAGMTA